MIHLEHIARLWRERLAHSYSRWESRLLQPHASVTLARMLVPFSLVDAQGERRPASPTQLLSERSVIIGAAGMGKSTFSAWLAGALLAPEHQALPLALPLRELRLGSDQSLDAVLESWIRRRMPSLPAGFLDPLLRASSGPRVLLILDGWDELGDRGPELRDLLMGLLTTYPRLGLVLTARPGALALPGDGEDMRVHRLAPLSDQGLSILSRRILELLEPERDAESLAQDFLDQLADHPHARSLARRPLLLQMMLLRHPKPLPRSTAQLYRQSFQVLLEARDPQGLRRHQLEELALQLWEQRADGLYASSLPESWTLAERRAFLQWAERDSGLLERRGSRLTFVHRSVGEYLAAQRLTRQYPDPVPRFCELAHTSSWAPVLSMWSGLVSDAQRSALSQALRAHAAQAHWAHWLRLHALSLDAELPELPRPAADTPTGAFLRAIQGSCDTSPSIATGRVLSAGSPLWPGSPWELALLAAWPSPRVALSRRLQQLALLGASREQLVDAARIPVQSRDRERWARALDRVWSGFLDDHGTYLAAESWAWATALSEPDCLPPFLPADTWGVLARTETPAHLGGAVALMRAACRERLGLPNDLDQRLQQLQADPLWRSLALVLAQRASTADRALLLDLAQHPERREPPLSWGLRWIVRGDILLLDGSALRLESLGLELPLLDP
ncbi:MAG: NACHT domain-containing protein [Myxococcota bacterium]|nr:NACHT domain-containing protein [Myxococcota bacterium]